MTQAASSYRPWLRIALRELAGGVAGFWIYLACLALGAWAIASAGSITDALQAGLSRQSHQLLGGDAAITLSQREASPEQRAWMDARGQVSAAAQIDLMARADQEVMQVDVRGIDNAFPLVGSFTFDRDIALPQILARTGDTWGIAASASLAKDLGIGVGDSFVLGGIPVQLRAILLRYQASGVTAEQVAGLLQELRASAQDGAQDEAREDVILDALDMVTGWCTPQLRVWDEAGGNRAS